MISVQEAQAILRDRINTTSKTQRLPLALATGAILSHDVISPIDMPPFRQSAMDGYALNANGQNVFQVIDEVKAGGGNEPEIKPGQAVRIFTGAAVPESASAVIMQEKVERSGDSITIQVPIKEGQNIRPRGEQVITGQIALKKGQKLSSAGIGFLASLGIIEVEVYQSPSIAVVVTGDELVDPGTPLQYGQIYESNAIMLSSLLKDLGYHKVSIQKVSDDFEATYQTLKSTFDANDVVLISGGISVGDYDFVGKALLDLGIEQHFYKIKQKPGKPLFFGTKGEKVVFALPGNPGSALSCFYIYVLEALNRISGNTSFALNQVEAHSLASFEKRGDRAQFLKAIYKDGKVSILEGQNSSMLHTFSLANAFVFLEEDQYLVKPDDAVKVILLPLIM